MTTEVATTVHPVAKLMKESYDLGVEHHSCSQLPTPYEDFEKRFTADVEFLIPIKEIYAIYRKGYRAGAPVIKNSFTPADLTNLTYTSKLDYVKADPRFNYVGGDGFNYNNSIRFTSIDEAYLYTQRYLENGGD